MNKKDLKKMIRKEGKRVIKNIQDNPHEPSFFEALILLMYQVEKIKKNKNG